MKKIIGTTRVVFVGRMLVFKFPRINLREIKNLLMSEISLFFEYSKRDGFKKHLSSHIKKKRELSKYLKTSAKEKNLSRGLRVLPHRRYEFVALNVEMFGGFMANWNEFIFFVKTRNKFLLPTYFSFFGLINIQKKGNVLNWKDGDFFVFLQNNSKIKDQIFVDAHSFDNPQNFYLDNGKLKMIDYGSRHCRSFILENWEQIQNNFPRPSKE